MDIRRLSDDLSLVYIDDERTFPAGFQARSHHVYYSKAGNFVLGRREKCHLLFDLRGAGQRSLNFLLTRSLQSEFLGEFCRLGPAGFAPSFEGGYLRGVEHLPDFSFDAEFQCVHFMGIAIPVVLYQ